MRLAFIWVHLVSTSLLLAQAQTVPLGTVITGHVYDSSDLPVADADIDVLPMGGMSGSLPHSKSDEKSAYRIVVPSALGAIRIFARKESRGYPDTRYWIFAPDPLTVPSVKVNKQEIQDVDIHLGSPGGTFKGSVIDASSRQVVTDVRIVMQRVQDPRCKLTASVRDGIFSYVLPKNPVEVRISAPGYADWVYVDPDTGRGELVMQPLGQKTVVVELRALPKSEVKH